MGIASNLLGATAGIFSGVAGTPGTSGNSNPFSLPSLPSLPSLTSLEQSVGIDTPAVQAMTAAAATPSTSIMDTVSAFFLRGTIIILGFIFVAVALSMFKPPAVIQETVGGVARVGGHIRRAAKATAVIAS